MGCLKTYRWFFAALLTLYLPLLAIDYFRHDDWMMLGTAVKKMPMEWPLLWKAYLYYAPDVKGAWFLRPFFLLAIYSNFHLFGYHYWLWILEQIVLLGATLVLATDTLERIRGKASDSFIFLYIFLFCIPLHFASVLWMGEGLMNIPQVFLMVVCLYGFLKSTKFGELPYLVAVLSYLAALFFKESSIVLPFILFFVLFSQGKLIEERFRLLLFFILGGIYFVCRFTLVVVNEGYHPVFNVECFLKPLCVFLFFCFLGPLVLTVLSKVQKNERPLFASPLLWIGYFSLIFLLILPHLGHWFFSPGWLYLPGFFASFLFPFLFKNPETLQKGIFSKGLVIFFLSVLPLGWQLSDIGWFSWGGIQKKAHRLVLDMDPKVIKRINLIECPNPNYLKSDLSRVVGSYDSFQHMWYLAHDSKIKVVELPCGTQVPKSPEVATLMYRFPEISLQ